MKNRLWAFAAGTAVFLLLSACGMQKESEENMITVGATPSPHAEILEAAREPLRQMGYTLKIIEFTDYIQPNLALSEGALDANYFQHAPYLNDFNQEHNSELESAGNIHYELFGIYPGNTKSLEELPDGAVITVPNDATNETRALLLLQEQGFIRLREGMDETAKATALDIVDNPKKLVIREIESAQLARSLQDVHLSVINGNFALQAGLSASQDALAIESTDAAGTYANIVAVQHGKTSLAKTQALVDALTSDTVRKYINDNYEGAVIPTF